MEKVPQIVRERLDVATPLANHPDADVLTAFAERSLPPHERATVLEHLSRCGDCREVVALALPESAPVAAHVAPSRAGWLTWPVLRWGFALAGVAVVASLGVVRYSRQTAPTMAKKVAVAFPAVAKNEAAPPPAVTDKEPPATAGKPQSKTQVSGLLATDEKKLVTRLKTTERDRADLAGLPASGGGATFGGPVGGPLPHGPKLSNQNQLNQWQANSNNFVAISPSAAPAAPSPQQRAQSQLAVNSNVPAQTQMVKVEAAAPAIETQDTAAQNLDLQNQPISKPSANEGYAESKVEKTKPAESLVIGPSKAVAGSTPSGADAFGYVSSTPRWAITSYGSLQRSFDQGASWQDVSVKGSPLSTVTGMMITAETVSPAKAAAMAKKKDAAKQQAAFEAPIVFRAVAALSSEVWAGGTAGQLYHSIDAGSHWVQVVPTNGQAFLTGDIVSLEFSDPRHGRVTTSTPEVWLTRDGGQSWEKQ